MRFDRCLVPNSICGPSRATVLTGKYSHANGFYNNTNSRFDGSQSPSRSCCKAAGYQTAIVGKWHLVSDPTGFDYWQILPGQGVYYNPPMIRNGERCKHEGYVDRHHHRPLARLAEEARQVEAVPADVPAQGAAPRVGAEPARTSATTTTASIPEPETLFDDYAGRGKAEHEQDMTIAKTMNQKDLKLVAAAAAYAGAAQGLGRLLRPAQRGLPQGRTRKGKDLVRWKYNRYMHDYLGCIKSVDESVGRVLKYLDDEGLADNTIVVYSSDQGFYLGEHGWFDKRWIFEESLRTPLLVRWPGVAKPGSVNKDIVSQPRFRRDVPRSRRRAGPERKCRATAWCRC